LLDKLVYTDLFLEKEKLDSLSIAEKKVVTNILTIPTTTNENFLGSYLPVFLDNNNNIKVVEVFFLRC
jgi:hypothetical protein